MLRANKILILATWAVVASGVCFAGAPIRARAENSAPLEAAAPLYLSKSSLQETMLATRAAYQATMPGQAEARRQVKLGPWHLAAAPVPEAQLAAATVSGLVVIAHIIHSRPQGL